MWRTGQIAGSIAENWGSGEARCWLRQRSQSRHTPALHSELCPIVFLGQHNEHVFHP